MPLPWPGTSLIRGDTLRARRWQVGVGLTALAALVLWAWPARDPCDRAVYPEQSSSLYVLPYPVGERHNVRQGNCNAGNTHNERYGASFAVDFEMPMGSRVVASRAGVVVRAVGSYSDLDHTPGGGNLVIVRHDDASYALYGHLQQDSLKVSVGDTVGPGQDLARSGDSGLSRGPHLHFTVLRCALAVGELLDFCETVPTTFRNTRPHPQGLIGSPTSALGGGEVYEAEVLPQRR